jgi:CubicO group peptidase (beta-lactamase class C family)
MKKMIYFFVYILIFIHISCQNKTQKKETHKQAIITQQLDSVKTKWANVKRQTIDLIIAEIAKRYKFNGCIVVKEEGKLLLKKCYGTSDIYIRDTENILKINHLFNIAGLTQIFTAMAIENLIEQNKIKIDAPLTQFFPKIKYKNLTIKHLLNHTSGLPDYQTYFLNNTKEANTYATNRNVLDWIIAEAPTQHFEADEKYEYSATNYVFLARIIELVTEQIWVDFLQENIAKKINLNLLYFPFLSETKSKLCVEGFTNDRKKRYDDHFLQYIYGAEGLWVSIDDMDKMENYYYQNNFSFEEEKQIIPSVTNEGKIVPFAQGWQIKPEENLWFQHSKWLAFEAGIWWWKKEDTKIIILTNDNCPVFTEIKDMILNILRGKKYKIPF